MNNKNIYSVLEICDSTYFHDIDKLYLGDGENIFEVDWLDELPLIFTRPFHKFQMIIRSSCRTRYINSFMMGMFGRICNFDVITLTQGITLKKDQDVDFFGQLIELQLLKQELWPESLIMYAIYYIANILYLLDANCCPLQVGLKESQSDKIETLEDYINILVRYGCDYAFSVPSRFIHRKMAKLLKVYATRNKKNRGQDSMKNVPDFLRQDLNNLYMVLNRRRAFIHALSNVNMLDSTLITNEILKEFEKIKREF